MTEKRTTYLELFFDLVFVFAVTQLADMLHHDHDGAGWIHAGVVAWLVWWAWSQFTWAGNAVDLERRGVRAAILAVSGLALAAAVAAPEAFSDNGAWFALAYAGVRMAGLALYWHGLRDEPDHRAALRSYLPIASISPVLVVAGGLGPPATRTWIWLSAVVIDLASVAAAGRGEFRIAPAHFSERHALFVIIVFGESIIAVGASITGRDLTIGLMAAGAVGFAVIAALWWTYFEAIQPRAASALASMEDHRRRAHLARDAFTLAHFPVVAGTVALAVGLEELLTRVADGGKAAFAWVALLTGAVSSRWGSSPWSCGRAVRSSR